MYSLAESKSLISETTAVLGFAQISDVNDDAILVLITNSFVFNSLPTYGASVLIDERRKPKHQIHLADAYITAKEGCIAIMAHEGNLKT